MLYLGTMHWRVELDPTIRVELCAISIVSRWSRQTTLLRGSFRQVRQSISEYPTASLFSSSLCHATHPLPFLSRNWLLLVSFPFPSSPPLPLLILHLLLLFLLLHLLLFLLLILLLLLLHFFFLYLFLFLFILFPSLFLFEPLLVAYFYLPSISFLILFFYISLL